jgi:hypothetical protein
MMSDKAKPPTATMATPNMIWTLDLPERLRLAIADAVVIFSRIDNALIEGIWVLEEADPKRKRQIARRHVSKVPTCDMHWLSCSPSC